MPTKRASKAKSSTKKAAKPSSARKQPAITIKLSPKQRAQLKKLSKGSIDAQTIQLDRERDIGQFLDSLVALARRPGGIKAPGIAPPPKDTYWV